MRTPENWTAERSETGTESGTNDTAAWAAAEAAGATDRLSREQVMEQYGHDLPEEMGDRPVMIFEGIDDGLGKELCTVASCGDYAFCLTCEAQGYLDGYGSDHAGIELWHREL